MPLCCLSITISLPYCLTASPYCLADIWPQVASLDVGKGIFKVVVNMVKKGAVAMRKKRGKEVPVNEDRGVKHCQVGKRIKWLLSGSEFLVTPKFGVLLRIRSN